MIGFILYFIFNVISPFLQKRGYNIRIGSISLNVVRMLLLCYNSIKIQIEYLYFKRLKFNFCKRTIHIQFTLNGLKINQKERLRASLDKIDADISISSIRNLSMSCNIPQIATVNISLINKELYIKCIIPTKYLYQLLPPHQIFNIYTKSLLSEQITILAYYQDKDSSKIPVIHYQVSGLDNYKDWLPDAVSLKKLVKAELMAKQHLEKEYVRYEDVSKLIKSVFIACEDPAFMFHYGVCPYAIGILLHNILNKRMPKGGGSSLTQQLIKNTFFSEETSIERKIKEALTSFVAERIFHISKHDILELYLNMAEFGIGIFGIKSAAHYYFDKSINNLSTIEVLVLTYILPRPKFFEAALRKNSQQLKTNLKKHILTNLLRLKQRHIIDKIPALPLKGISFSKNLPFLQFDTPALLDTISYIVIHCSATKPNQKIGVEELRDNHLCRSFDDIGYHWVINIDGTIEKGRSEKYQGAHCQGYNDKSIGICYIGGLDDNGIPSNTMTAQQEESLIALCSKIKNTHPNIHIIGHNQISDKICPCFDVKEWVYKNNL